MANESYVFGSGDAYVLTPASPVQAIKVATLTEVELAFKSEVIRHHGKAKFPLAVADGKGTVTGKASMAAFQADAVNAILGGTLTSTGHDPVAVETGTIPGTPYQVTASGGGATTVDLGAKIAGVQATRVAGPTPSAGQYVFSSGQYTFAAADTAKAYEISSITPNTTSGQAIALGNPTMGVSSTFKLYLAETEAVSSKKITVELFAVKFLDLNLKFATEDFTIPDVSFEAFADATLGLGKITVAA